MKKHSIKHHLQTPIPLMIAVFAAIVTVFIVFANRHGGVDWWSAISTLLVAAGVVLFSGLLTYYLYQVNFIKRLFTRY